MKQFKFIPKQDYKPNKPVTHITVEGYSLELPEKIKGKIFEDSNGNLVPYQHEKGLIPTYNGDGEFIGYMRVVFE